MRRTSEPPRPRFWLPAAAGALFILAGAYWVSKSMFPADPGVAAVDAGASR
jgi:hypothetical protein